MRVALMFLLVGFVVPAHAAAASWRSVGSASSGLTGDATKTFGYVAGRDFVRLDARTLAPRRTALDRAGCRPRAMARGAALLTCPDRTTRLVTTAGAVVPVAATDGTREPATTAPIGIGAFGDLWLERYYSSGQNDLLQWHTGEVRPSSGRGRDLNLDIAEPVPFADCGPGQTLDRRGNRALVLRLAPGGGGTINVVDCRTTKATRLARLETRDHVEGQIGPEVATWSSRSTVGAVRLGALRPVSYRLPGASPSATAPVKVAHAAGRLLVSVITPDGSIKLLTRRLPRP